MDQAFNALEFVVEVEQGAFDGSVNEVLLKLRRNNCKSVALLPAQRVNGTISRGYRAFAAFFGFFFTLSLLPFVLSSVDLGLGPKLILRG